MEQYTAFWMFIGVPIWLFHRLKIAGYDELASGDISTAHSSPASNGEHDMSNGNGEVYHRASFDTWGRSEPVDFFALSNSEPQHHIPADIC